MERKGNEWRGRGGGRGRQEREEGRGEDGKRKERGREEEGEVEGERKAMDTGRGRRERKGRAEKVRGEGRGSLKLAGWLTLSFSDHIFILPFPFYPLGRSRDCQPYFFFTASGERLVCIRKRER